MNQNLLGRTYGPFTYEAGAEKIREFALGLYGAPPASLYPQPPPASVPREYLTAERVVAPPTFCVTFAIKPFVSATFDPELNLNLAMLVHAEQELEFVEPVRAGDVLTTTGTIAELYEKAEKEFVIVKTESRNQHGRVAVKAVWTAIVRKG